jgi:trigger factor
MESFKNENVSFDKEILPNCRVKYTVSPSDTLWEKAKAKAIKQISKQISIPGFRKGKAPQDLILKNHPQQVKHSTDQAIADICFEECQKEAKVPILQGHNNISFHFGEKEESGKLFFTFETEPQIPSINISDFKLKDIPKVEIDEKLLNEEIDRVRSFYATWEEIQDRGVEENDFILVDIDDIDQDPKVQVFSGARFEVSKNKMADWMKNLVMGKKIGESVEGFSEADASATDEVKQNFKKKKVCLTIKSIERAILPPLDEEFAQKVGAKDLSQMKQNLKNLAQKKEDRERAEQLREDIEKQMIEKVLFDVPASLLEKEANHRVSQLFANPSFKKKWETELTDEEKEQKKEEIKEKSTQAIRLFYLCRDIIQKNKISIGEKDLESSAYNLLEMMYEDKNKLQYNSMSEEQKQMALTQTMMHKAEDQIIAELLKS